MSQTFVHIFSGSVEVLALRDALQAVNIIPVIKDEAESARLAGFGATPNLQRVFVHPMKRPKPNAFATNYLRKITS